MAGLEGTASFTGSTLIESRVFVGGGGHDQQVEEQSARLHVSNQRSGDGISKRVFVDLSFTLG